MKWVFAEIYACIDAVEWVEEFSIEVGGKLLHHQKGYNKALELEFEKREWELQPKLAPELRLKGDFRKNDIFIEVQFGNSATIYRDYYKFHYGLLHKNLALAVLIVPTEPRLFFPTRPESVVNMASFAFATRCFEHLPIPVPIMLVGLVPEN